jgi:hypothetical protein
MKKDTTLFFQVLNFFAASRISFAMGRPWGHLRSAIE